MKKKVNFDLKTVNSIIKEMISKEYFFTEGVRGIMLEDDDGRINNIMMDIPKNEWNLINFSFMDMTKINRGLAIILTFSEYDRDEVLNMVGNSVSISYQKNYGNLTELLISDDEFKNLLTHIKSNKDKINFEFPDFEIGFENFE